MFPVAATVSNTAPVPSALVASPLPENFAQRVPSSNVPPSVSSVQIYNNARGNGSYTPVTSVAQMAVPVVEGDAATGVAGSVASSKISATFLAQIIGQGVPSQLQGTLSNVLASYDQLVSYGFVKYRPSNASLPPPPPTGVFDRILAQEHAAPQPQQQVRVDPQPVQVQQPQPQIQQAAVQVIQAVAPEIKQSAPAEKPAPQQQAAPKRAAVKVAIAYLMSEARVDMEAPPALKASA